MAASAGIDVTRHKVITFCIGCFFAALYGGYFGAGLGIILEELGEDKRALEALRRALEINPHMDNVPEIVRRLKLKVEGREI